MVAIKPWTMLVHKHWLTYKMRPPSSPKDTKFLKPVSWNVNGLKALLKLHCFYALCLAQKEEFICFAYRKQKKSGMHLNGFCL